MASDYAHEPCECGAPALVLVLDNRGHVCAAASALNAGAAGDRWVIRPTREKVTR